MRLFSDRRILAIAGILFAAVLLVSVNILAGRWLSSARVDLTDQKLYTLSDGTTQLLRGVQEPITLRFYLSSRLTRDVPSFAGYAQRVQDLLQEYAARSNGRIRLETYDPEPFSDVEDRATAYGLQGVPVDQNGELVYFGLVGTNTTDDEQVIPFFQQDRERFLEYDLTKMVYQLARPKQRVVGVISTLPVDGDLVLAQGGEPHPWVVMDQIRQFFTVRSLGTDVAEIPSDVDALMVVHPANLSDKTQFAIDQFVLKGGKAMVFVDPYSEGAAFRSQAGMMRGMPPQPTESDLGKLLTAWGVKFDHDHVVGDRRLARRVSTGASGRAQSADYIAWLGADESAMSHNDAITGQLRILNFASAGILDPAEGATTTFEPLVTSSNVAERLPVSKINSGTPNLLQLIREFQSGGKPLTIAARITGPAKSAFPDGLPAPAPAAAKPGEPPPAPPAPTPAGVKDGKINVVVVADSDMLEDRFWVQVQNFFDQRVAVPTANNADFVVNALDDLTGSDALIGLRSRGVSDRPFTRLRDIQQVAENQYSQKEQALEDKLKETQRKLGELRGSAAAGQGAAGSQGAAGGGILSPDQAKQIEQFRAEIIQTRGELRDVQRSLRQDIQSLRAWVEFATIAAVPILVALVALVLGFVRARRRRAAVQVA